jgi:hypothetical protein
MDFSFLAAFFRFYDLAGGPRIFDFRTDSSLSGYPGYPLRISSMDKSRTFNSSGRNSH